VVEEEDRIAEVESLGVVRVGGISAYRRRAPLE
jgi:hypothetical protein